MEKFSVFKPKSDDNMFILLYNRDDKLYRVILESDEALFVGATVEELMRRKNKKILVDDRELILMSKKRGGNNE